MKIPISGFDLDGFLARLEENYVRVCLGDAAEGFDAHAGLLQKVVDCYTIEDFAPDWRAADVASHLSVEGASVFLTFAVGEFAAPFANCTDGARRRVLEKDDVCLGESDLLGYLVTRKGECYEFLPVDFYLGGCPGPGPEMISASQRSRYWSAMQVFARRFEREGVA